MARSKTLGALVTQLRTVLGHDRSPAAGAAFVDHLKEAIRSAQEELYDEFAWPFLICRRDKTVNAGQRYYDFPTDLPLENISSIEALWGGQYYPVDYGITPAEYSQYNSDSNVRSDPVQKWAVLNTGTVQYELWPLPATTLADGIRFHGRKALNALVDTNDISDLDDRLICYRAATIMSTDEKRITKFNGLEMKRMAAITGKLANPQGTPPVVIGGAAQRAPWRGTVIRIAGT